MTNEGLAKLIGLEVLIEMEWANGEGEALAGIVRDVVGTLVRLENVTGCKDGDTANSTVPSHWLNLCSRAVVKVYDCDSPSRALIRSRNADS